MSEEKDTMRKKFKRKVMVGVGFLLALGGGAFAAILISALIGGSMTVIDKPAVAWKTTGATQVSTDGSGIACAPTVSGGKLNVGITNAMPGSSCTIEAETSPTTTAGLAVQGIDMSGLDVKLVKNPNNSASRLCGELLPTNGASAAYRMVLTVPENTTAGVKPINGQLSLVPQAQYDPALCNN